MELRMKPDILDKNVKDLEHVKEELSYEKSLLQTTLKGVIDQLHCLQTQYDEVTDFC